ncbi:MAG: Antitoxin component of bacterial toxin-antitoxin system, MqsA [Nitrospira sp.]|jgi:transcriptional regulator with XRE-family HTH domain|nr:Antitoxin component of bacterial toxin-antitoxin system, MqsA [Nitrospira sp.]
MYTYCIDSDVNGAALRQQRKKLHLTQRELAEELGVATNTVARYERDESGIPEPVARLVMLLHPKRKP